MRTQRSMREMTSITLHFCCWAFLGLFNNLLCSRVQISTVLISKAECVGEGVRACVMRLLLGKNSGILGYWFELKILKTVKCVFEVPLGNLQAWSLWSEAEKTRKPLEMHFEHIFWGIHVWCCPAPNITLCLGLCNELDCGTGIGMAKECCRVCWAAALQRNISKPQHRSPGESTATQGRW